jgi:hypothetical protein
VAAPGIAGPAVTTTGVAARTQHVVVFVQDVAIEEFTELRWKSIQQTSRHHPT